MLHIQADSDAYLRDATPSSYFLRRFPPETPRYTRILRLSKVYQIRQLRTNDIHYTVSTGKGLYVLTQYGPIRFI